MIQGKLDIRKVNVKDIKKIYQRPKWLDGVDIPAKDTIVEEMDVEVNTPDDHRDLDYSPPADALEMEDLRKSVPAKAVVQTKKSKESARSESMQVIPQSSSSRPQRNVMNLPKAGDKVDVRFIKPIPPKGQKAKEWHCGKISRVVHKNVEIEFEDGRDNGWYTIGLEATDLHPTKDLRPCIPGKDGHERSSVPQCAVLIICDNVAWEASKPSRKQLKNLKRMDTTSMEVETGKERL
jgi:hypothetical protein